MKTHPLNYSEAMQIFIATKRHERRIETIKGLVIALVLGGGALLALHLMFRVA